MVAKELINFNIPVLNIFDTVEKALLLLHENHFSEFPLVENEKVLALISEDSLVDFDKKSKIGQLDLPNIEVFVDSNMPLLEIVKLFKQNRQNSLAVLDSNNNFVGLLQKTIVFEKTIELFDLDSIGGILELRFKGTQFSLSEISRIIEMEGFKIKTMYQKEEFEAYETNTILTLKLNSVQISTAINALGRHGFDVSAYYSTESVTNIERDRYDLLMKYLSI